ncbi:MAG: PA2169 family four-helix-bundle protein [Proteobacteria bacterium]|nr:PA2169 family four-helix-bundle protein [Pseudomonadota bacterium]
MATSVGKEDDKLEMLQDLIKLDLAAAEAYDAAIERLDDASYRQQLGEFMRDHQRHVAELSPIVRQMGGEVPDSGGAKELLTEGKVAMSSLMGDDAILKAMKTNEDDTNTAYERVAEKCPVEARDIVTRGLADERRHREWIMAQLGEGTVRSEGRPRGVQDESRPGYQGPR